ncbi:MAG: NAD(P)H-binding protein [Myxococcales bacterium]|nr:NAD(P)H-binding protein [Myxococcales bacterium]
MSKILVTGASGNVGREVVRALVARGHEPITADRSSARAPGPSTSRALDFHDASTWERAVEGCSRLFLLRPPAIADVRSTLLPFVDFARTRGVDHVVFLSVAGAERNRFIPHNKVERHLRATSDRFTNLRPGFFAQNLETAYLRDIVEDRRIYVPAGNAAVNWIDARDIGEVAAIVLDAPEHHRAQSYTLTGPGAVAWSVVTDALSSALGHDVRYEPASIVGYVRHLRRRKLPAGAIAVQTVLHAMLRFGQGATLDPTAARLLRRAPRSIGEYVRDNAAVFRRAINA